MGKKHTTQIPDPYHAEWYDVQGTIIGYTDDEGDMMIVHVDKWRPTETPHREGGWIHTASVRFPLLILRWSGNDYHYLDGEDGDGQLMPGERIGFTTNRREQDDYIKQALALQAIE